MKMFKRIPTLMAVLMPVFLFSIGFSSWTIFSPLNPVSTEGSFEAYDVSEYFSWASTDMFEYTSLYFVEDDRVDTDGDGKADYDLNSVNVGKIVVTYNFTSLAKTQAATEDGLTVKFTLSCNNLKQSNNANPKLFTASNTIATIGSESYPPETATDVFEFTHTFSGDIGNSFTVTYTFSTTVGQGFRNDFGQYFLNDYGSGENKVTTEFVTSAEAEVSK
ncbi:MAG: hypothetical protein IJY69_02775 [Clostridia bacterium]|nr:hypothetical protein [Clostridia bacterium]